MKWAALLSLLFVFAGCRTVQYVPVETVRTDSIYQTRIERDSIYQRDSVYIVGRGDTVFEYRYRYHYIDRYVHDTLFVTRVDSVQVPYPVERAATRRDIRRQRLGSVAMFLVGLMLLCGVVVLVRKIVKRL